MGAFAAKIALYSAYMYVLYMSEHISFRRSLWQSDCKVRESGVHLIAVGAFASFFPSHLARYGRRRMGAGPWCCVSASRHMATSTAPFSAWQQLDRVMADQLAKFNFCRARVFALVTYLQLQDVEYVEYSRVGTIHSVRTGRVLWCRYTTKSLFSLPPATLDELARLTIRPYTFAVSM